MLSSFLHPGRGYQKAQEAMLPYYQQAQSYMAPYHQRASDAYSGLSGAMNSLLNPAELQSEWSEGYQESPYAKQLEDMAMNRGLNAASRMGLLGSSPALQSLQAGTTMISNADRERYMDSLMNKYMQGASIAQGIYGTGAGAGQQMGANALNMGGNMGNLAYGRQNAPGNLFGNMLNAALYGFSGGF
jgi:hypothetical protein